MHHIGSRNHTSEPRYAPPPFKKRGTSSVWQNSALYPETSRETNTGYLCLVRYGTMCQGIYAADACIRCPSSLIP